MEVLNQNYEENLFQFFSEDKKSRKMELFDKIQKIYDKEFENSSLIEKKEEIEKRVRVFYLFVNDVIKLQEIEEFIKNIPWKMTEKWKLTKKWEFSNSLKEYKKELKKALLTGEFDYYKMTLNSKKVADFTKNYVEEFLKEKKIEENKEKIRKEKIFTEVEKAAEKPKKSEKVEKSEEEILAENEKKLDFDLKEKLSNISARLVTLEEQFEKLEKKDLKNFLTKIEQNDKKSFEKLFLKISKKWWEKYSQEIENLKIEIENFIIKIKERMEK